MQTQAKRLDIINILRLIGAYLIIVIHTCAFPYMTMGIVINKYKLNEKVKHPYIILAIALILHAIEGYMFSIL
ncbi:hypothetical protein [Cellulosilyticum ruminicola]|uniref:hypothetical protein n=1 Tax=Cellulosilyticum ruminicola TaxID=425254 RepID=UPI0006D21AA7|nr:hypothetical protein [Cellulosilyticum ruminicola]